MKLEVLQSLSMTVMIVGLFLSALGGFGAYFFSGGTERTGRGPTSAQIVSSEPDLPERDSLADSDGGGTDLLAETTARQLSLMPEPTLEPVAEKLPHPPNAGKTEPPAEESPAIPAIEQPADLPPSPEKLPSTARITTPPEPSKIAKTVPATSIPKTAPSKASAPADLAPVAEKLPERPEPPKLAKKEPSPSISTGEIPETKASASAGLGLGIEPKKLDKLLDRLRTFPRGTIAIQVPENNDEAMDFARALKEAFHTAGWTVASLSTVEGRRDTNGLTLSSGTFPPPSDVTTVFSALVSAGIKLSTDLDPKQGKKHPTLFVGSRP